MKKLDKKQVDFLRSIVKTMKMDSCSSLDLSFLCEAIETRAEKEKWISAYKKVEEEMRENMAKIIATQLEPLRLELSALGVSTRERSDGFSFLPLKYSAEGFIYVELTEDYDGLGLKFKSGIMFVYSHGGKKTRTESLQDLLLDERLRYHLVEAVKNVE